MRHTVTVLIAGTPATGKTTVAQTVFKALAEAGFCVELYEPNIEPRRPVSQQKLKAVSDNVTVRVYTGQLNRACFNKTTPSGHAVRIAYDQACKQNMLTLCHGIPPPTLPQEEDPKP